MKSLQSLLLWFLTACLVASCLGDEDYSLSENDRLAFSQDTVRLDTLLSGTPANTYRFMVYNQADKALRIPSVWLEQGAASPFRVNVDGTYLADGAAGGFEIGSHDSLIVFLSVFLPETDSDEPVFATDRLHFLTEAGVDQQVVLEAAGQDVITYHTLYINKDTVLASRRPYQILDSLVVAPGATLTMAPGTKFFFHADASLLVHGTLHAVGTQEQPILWRGDRLGNMFDGQPYDRIPSQWGGVRFCGESYDNKLEYVDMHSSTWGMQVDSSDVSRDKLYLYNCVLHNVTHNAFSSRMANVYVVGTQISNAGENCVLLRGGDATFVHCTIARFYAFTGAKGGVALDFANFSGDTMLPLSRADFINCIVTGYQEDEIMGAHAEDETIPFAYAFYNSLLRTPPYEDENLTACLWDYTEQKDDLPPHAVAAADNFFPAFNYDALVFPFTLHAESAAIGNAEVNFASLVAPEDRLGTQRTADGAPDIGAYEYVAPAEAAKHRSAGYNNLNPFLKNAYPKK